MRFFKMYTMILILSLSTAKAESIDVKPFNNPAFTSKYIATELWRTEFTDVAQLTNKNAQSIYEWHISWKIKNNTLTNAWNSLVNSTQKQSDTDVYIAKNLDWNEKINENQSIEFALISKDKFIMPNLEFIAQKGKINE
ncbi:cellulose binding domain-containing protein [Marinicellulosiphila megalodicopiae]|uniref:cellulose binding domain-containing protein n=1 Tax=Marinicellulosiphila megalodicopiae TaxID=2724896 RepID=UPI003BB13887